MFGAKSSQSFSFGSSGNKPASTGLSFGLGNNKPASSGFSLGSTTQPKPLGFSLNNTNNTNNAPKPFSLSQSGPNIFGNSATTGQTTTNALTGGIGGGNSNMLFGQNNNSNNNTNQMMQSQSNDNPYNAHLASLAMNTSGMPKALTAPSPRFQSKRKRSPSIDSQSNYEFIRDGSIPVLGEGYKHSSGYGVENVAGLFTSSDSRKESKSDFDLYTKIHHVPVKKSEYRRLVITHPRDSFKHFKEIDPNAVLLKDVRMQSFLGTSGASSSFRPPVKKVRVDTRRNNKDSSRFEFSPSVPTTNEPIKSTLKQPVKPEFNVPPGYWCVPSLHTLSQMSVEHLSRVNNFTIGRKGYGQIRYDMPVDLSDFQGKWDDLMGKTIEFRGNIVVVYGNVEEENKPAPGNGLNVPATVTSEACYPKDAKTKQIIKDPEYSGLDSYVNKLKNIAGMTFLNYEPVNGTFTFKVQHFSIWGIIDEDNEDPKLVMKYKKQQEMERAKAEEEERLSKHAEIEAQKAMEQESNDKEKEDDDDIFMDAESDMESAKAYEPEIKSADILAIKALPKFPTANNWDQQLRLSSGFESVFNKNLYNIGKASQKDTVNKLLFAGENTDDLKQKVVVPVEEFPMAEQYKACIDSDISYAKFQKRTYTDIPRVKFDERISLGSVLQAFQGSKIYETWHLLAILFDDDYCFAHLTDKDIEFCKQKPELRQVLEDIKRRELLCSWLERLGNTDIRRLIMSSQPMDQIYYLLCAGRLGDATNLSVKTHNPHLSITLSMIDSNDPEIKELASSQLDDWKKNSSLALIPRPILKIYKLLSGKVLSDSIVPHLEGLSWPTVLYMLLTYGDSNLPLSDIIRDFVGYVETNSALQPTAESDTFSYYHLIKLFMEPSQMLATFSTEMQFLLVKKLNVFLNLDSQVADETCRKFSKKLVAHGMVNEAVFILEHLSNDEECKDEITSVVSSHIDQMGFLKNNIVLDQLHVTLGLSLHFLYMRRASKFESLKQYTPAVQSLINAKELDKAQDMTLETVAPSYVIGKTQLDILKGILESFKLLPSWSEKGQIYYDYICLSEYEKSEETYKIKSLVGELINNLSLLKQDNFEIKVAITIMSKKLIALTFKYDIDYNASNLLSLELPPSETNYLKNKLPKETVRQVKY